jgi:anti-sigma B factor antagonist
VPITASRLSIASEREGQAHVVQLVGDLDQQTAQSFEDELMRVEATGATEIVVDLGRLQSIDYMGLNILIHAAARSETRGGGLRLVPGSDRLQRKFRRTGLESRLPFADRLHPLPDLRR